ncbi:MAG: RagB/SusD family nutrient uptake outer membrane protein [Mediterranea sp.]|jgi:hypothetical protein|nr:RagB/SusD family nutrient uptake outer membrane protein [Mediterranea sp.]
MNRFKFNILTAGILLFACTACSESFLDTESKTESTTDNFYKTESDALRALYGCYDGWKHIVSNGGVSFYLASEIMSDECFGATGIADARNYQAIDRFDISQSPADLNLFETDWKSYYAAIYRCNSLIAREEQIAWSDPTVRGTYMGECRALRAIFYFDMVRLWGNIPLFTEPINENLPQANPDDVYAVIFDDLKYAAANIPANAYPKAQSATNEGHITAYAAKALLARAYLYYTGYYGKEPVGITKAEVLQGLEDIISSNEYSLIPEFKNLWPASSTTWTQAADGSWSVSGPYIDAEGNTISSCNAETILAQRFNYTSNWSGVSDHNAFLVMIGIRTAAVMKPPYGQGWGSCTVNPKLLSAYATGDTRGTASIIDLAGEGLDVATQQIDQREYTGYTIKKYTPMSKYLDGAVTDAITGLGIGNMMISQYQDFVVMRYADVLLMAAELGSANAKTYLNDVRRRAYTTDGTVNAGFAEIEATPTNIMNERMLEFAFEAQRYWDLLRQGVDYAANQIAGTTNVLSGGNADQVVITADKMRATQGLSQIPYNQINLSGGVLKQNPGW